MEISATTLEDAYAAVELFPLESGDPRYVDCAQVRGGPDTKLDEVMGWRIEVARQPVHQLLSGHRGCGKSTELLRLARRLRDKGYFVIYFAAAGQLRLLLRGVLAPSPAPQATKSGAGTPLHNN